jgi:putative flippase GtrA
VQPDQVQPPGDLKAKLQTVGRFLISGLLNTFATLVLYWLLLYLFSPHAAYAISFASGVALSYLLNLRFVFRERHSTRKMIIFPAVYLLTYAVGALALQLAIRYWGVAAGLAPLLSIACTVPISFLLLRWLLTDRMPRQATPSPSSRRN